MKKLKEFIRKLDCHGRQADLAMTSRRKSSDNLFNLTNLSPYRCYARTYLGWLRSKAVTTAFTMAEILLSLTIIGIVAAITLPSLMANFQDKAFSAKKQALHTRLAQAFKTLDYNDYPNIRAEYYDEEEDTMVYPTVNKFMEDLGQVIEIKEATDPYNIFSNRGDEWQNPLSLSSLYYFADYPTVYFQTANGESIGIKFGDLQRAKNDKKYPTDSMLFVLVYDLNGQKGPNKWGKDLGVMGAFYPDSISLVAPSLAVTTNDNVNHECTDEGFGSGICSLAKYPDYRLPSIEELIVLKGMYTDEYLGGSCWHALNGKSYDWSLLNFEEPLTPVEDSESCVYPLVTNDGSIPKGGVIRDLPEEGN